MKNIIKSLMIGLCAISILVTPFNSAMAVVYTYKISKSPDMPPTTQDVYKGQKDVTLAAYEFYTREDIEIKKMIIMIEGYLKFSKPILRLETEDGTIVAKKFDWKYITFDPSFVLKKGKTTLYLKTDIPDNGEPLPIWASQLYTSLRYISAQSMNTGKTVNGLINYTNFKDYIITLVK